MSCCTEEKDHGEECKALWRDLKEYTINKMLVELDIDPFIKQE